MISPEGLSKPFSKQADGYGRGEGCGVLFLKPLKKVRLLAKQCNIRVGSPALKITFPEKIFQFKLKINETFIKH